MTKAILSSEPTPENIAAGHCLFAALFEVDSLGIFRPGDQAWTCFSIRSLNGDGEGQEEEEEGEGDDQEEGEEEEDGGCACGYPINKGEFNKKKMMKMIQNWRSMSQLKEIMKMSKR
jgi:hypothetical protein